MTSELALIAVEHRSGDGFIYLEKDGKRTEIYDGFCDLDEAQEVIGRQLVMIAAAEWMLGVCELVDARLIGPGPLEAADLIEDLLEGFSDDLPPVAAVRKRIVDLRERERQVPA